MYKIQYYMGDDNMIEKEKIALRLATLRTTKNVSARLYITITNALATVGTDICITAFGIGIVSKSSVFDVSFT